MSEPLKRQELVAAVKRDITAIASIYPTAFDLYDEPLARLAERVVTTIVKATEANNNDSPGERIVAD